MKDSSEGESSQSCPIYTANSYFDIPILLIQVKVIKKIPLPSFHHLYNPVP